MSWTSVCSTGRSATSRHDLEGDVSGDWLVDARDRDLVLALWATDWPQADVNGDGRIGVGDLTLVLGNWRGTFGQQFLGDITGDCVVDMVDQKILLAVWGPGFPQADLNADGTTNTLDLTTLLANYGNTEWWLTLRGEYGGGAWTVKRNFGVPPFPGLLDSVDYNDLRGGVGVEWINNGGLSGLFEVGIAFEREIRYRYYLPTVVRPNPTVYMRGGLTY